MTDQEKVELLGKQIEILTDQKRRLQEPKTGDWFINDKNTYFQFVNKKDNCVQLSRHGVHSLVTISMFEEDFRRATPSQIKQHEEFLAERNLAKVDLFNIVRVGSHIVKRDGERIYQITKIENGIISLDGITKLREISYAELNRYYVLADAKGKRLFHELRTANQIAKNSTYGQTVAKPFDITKCDFYMLTVRGDKGSKVRHNTYEEATKEATRIATFEDHQVYIMGVVAVAEPVREFSVKIKTK